MSTNDPGAGPADIRIAHGNPTPAEVAALVVALTPAPGNAANARTAGPSVPAWTHAALLESVGGPTVYTPADLPSRDGPQLGV